MLLIEHVGDEAAGDNAGKKLPDGKDRVGPRQGMRRFAAIVDHRDAGDAHAQEGRPDPQGEISGEILGGIADQRILQGGGEAGNERGVDATRQTVSQERAR